MCNRCPRGVIFTWIDQSGREHVSGIALGVIIESSIRCVNECVDGSYSKYIRGIDEFREVRCTDCSGTGYNYFERG